MYDALDKYGKTEAIEYVEGNSEKVILHYKVPNKKIAYISRIKVNYYPKTEIEIYLDSFVFRFKSNIDRVFENPLKIVEDLKIVIKNNSNEGHYYHAQIFGYISNFLK